MKEQNRAYQLGYVHGLHRRKRILHPEPSAQFEALLAAEVAWYRANGRYKEDRVKVGRDGLEYVIGDVSWNRPGRPNEYIELGMATALQERTESQAQ